MKPPIIHMNMNEPAEIINSSEMTTLICIPVQYENDEEITSPQNAEKSEVCVCLLDKNIIIASRSKKSGRLISEVVFEKQNISQIAKGFDQLLSEENPFDAPVEFENGGDKILITFSSSWAHNLPAPLERVNFYNRRNYELDGLRAQDMWLSLPPKPAQRLAEELTKLF